MFPALQKTRNRNKTNYISEQMLLSNPNITTTTGPKRKKHRKVMRRLKRSNTQLRTQVGKKSETLRVAY